MNAKTDLTILLEKHDERKITLNEREQLHILLKEIYAYGDRMSLYRCPECKKPLVYMWSGGPQCLFGQGGCGYIP